MSSQIDRKQLWQRLHQRLLSGSSPTVTGEIATEFLPVIIRSLSRVFPNVNDPHLIETAAEEAIIFYLDHPAQFDPARASLFTYLRMRAKGYLLNSLGRQKNSQASQEGGKVVELDGVETVYRVETQDEDDAETALIERESKADIEHRLSEIITDPAEFKVLALMLEGVRETSTFADALGITDQPLAEQARLVKQCKDRIKKAVQRKYKI